MSTPLARVVAGLMPLFLLLDPATSATTVGAIEGRVRDVNGSPLPGARVAIGTSRHFATADAVGHYRLEGVSAGSYTLVATLAGYDPARAEGVIVNDGGTTFRDFTLDARTGDAAKVTAHEQAENRGAQAAAPPAADASRAGRGEAGAIARRRPPEPWNTEEYRRIYENTRKGARDNPLSTFSIDVDRASYGNVRRFLLAGRRPPADAVRIEEMVNYFEYDYPEPRGVHPFSVTTDVAPAPWNTEHRLVRIGLQGRRYRQRELPPSNLVFLIDVSGSMSPPDRLPLVKEAFRLLVGQLRPSDRVAIVVYAGRAGLVLPSTAGDEKHRILRAIDRLEAGGSTAGGAGIRLAYDIAREHRIEGGNNRVILATDGDFNVGVSSEGALVRMIEERRREGTALTILGFGRGNLKDSRMEQLADHGNGNYAYVDNLLEARKIFVTELTGTLFTIAKDVKVQVEFNPALVSSYRLIGYENRMLETEDFDDDTRDAGDLGAGHTVTALYEIVPAGGWGSNGRELRYQGWLAPRGRHGGEWLTVQLRYKPPESDESRLLTHVLRRNPRAEQLSGDFGFAASVAAFGMVLRGSEHRGDATIDLALELAREFRGPDEDGYRAELIRLMELARESLVADRFDR